MSKIIKPLQWTVAFLLLCYIVYRGCCISITQDEAYTYFLVKTNHWRSMPGTANTHWLNSIMLRLFLWLPGPDDPWKLRLLSMSCWLLYSYSVIRLSGFFKSKVIALTFFSAALLNPFVVFYFSLSRGYAAAFALAMFSFLQAAGLLQRRKIHPRQWLWVFIPASLAVLSNFTTFYFYMSLTAVYFIHLLAHNQVRVLKDRKAVSWILLVLITFIFSISALLFIRHTGDLEYGGRSGMVSALFGSLAATGTYIPFEPTVLLQAGWYIFIVLAVLFIAAIYTFTRTKDLTFSELSVFCCAGIVCLNVLLHAVFEVPYLMGRTALIIYVTLLPGLFGMADRINIKNNGAAFFRGACVGMILVFFSINFSRSYNARFFPEWPVQADTQKGLDYLAAKRADYIGMGVWHYAVYFNYYMHAYPGKYPPHAQFIKPDEIKSMADTAKLAPFNYLFLDPPYDDLLKYLGNWKKETYYPDSKALILSRRL